MTPAESDDYSSALAFLYARLNFERSAAPSYHSPAFRLQRMNDLLAPLGDPHLDRPTIHVAGTKGKGSTCVMLSSMLQAQGSRVGLYSSPHLSRLEERFQINQQPCTARELVQLVSEMRPLVERLDRQAAAGASPGPTFFEITTAMAFLHFARSDVHWTVLETGLGGRLDSTNACRPSLCIVTSISLDHTRQLGGTLDRIAREKAGIIKPGVPAISGVAEPASAAEITAAAQAADVRLEVLGVNFHCASRPKDPLDPLGGQVGRYEDCDGSLELQLRMNGEHQGRNAGLAIRALRRLRAERKLMISDRQILDGLASAACPGRLESWGGTPQVVLDVAHNEASIAALLKTLAPLLDSQRPTALVFAASRDKDAVAMLQQLLPRFDHVLLTKFRDNPRAMSLEELGGCVDQARQRLAQIAPPQHPRHEPSLQFIPAAQDALEQARRLAQPAGLVCITGSFFLAAELREWGRG